MYINSKSCIEAVRERDYVVVQYRPVSYVHVSQTLSEYA